jgi:putative FmdB family regulatory protein
MRQGSAEESAKVSDDMPIYEYRCEPCDHAFETLIRSSGDVAHCPQCGNIEVKKQFSVPAAAHTGQASSLPVCETGAKNFGCGGGQCMSGMCDMG